MLQAKYRTRIYYTESQKAAMWDRWQQGDSLHAIARQPRSMELPPNTGIKIESHRSVFAVTYWVAPIQATPRPRSTYDSSVIDAFNLRGCAGHLGNARLESQALDFVQTARPFCRRSHARNKPSDLPRSINTRCTLRVDGLIICTI